MLNDEVAIVTGGASGMGYAIGLALAREGARVAVFDKEDASDVVQAISAIGGHGRQFRVDVGDPEDVIRGFAAVTDGWGAVDLLVNVAGVFRTAPIFSTPLEEWELMFGVNARGIFLCTKEAAGAMMSRNRGRIINILSTGAAQAFALQGVYCASKAAALMLTRAAAVELGPYGVAVNGVAPGTVLTETGRSYLSSPGISAYESARTPLGRLGDPLDVVQAVIFFATTASWTTGQVLYVDGGFLATGLPVDVVTSPHQKQS